MATTMTAADVCRLLGRVAFGATAADVDNWTGKPYADLVDSLLAVPADATHLPSTDEISRIEYERGGSEDVWGARQWWLERMRTARYPLEERMTLLWHGHFATGVRYPPMPSQLVLQNQTIRTHALGSFRDLVAALTVDPAMLIWLNGFENVPPHANENYAREFFELFTLGKRPQVYKERDIREAARAFTGWSLDGNGAAAFSAGRHDHKTKKVLGKTVSDQGASEYLTLVDIALSQPVAARFIAWKLVANLAYLPAVPNLMASKDPLLNRVAASLRKDWDVKAALRVLMLSNEFRYGSAARQLVRTPVESTVHAAKALGVKFNDYALVYPLETMGHSLFNPVNVGGWPLGRDWISPVTAMARYDQGLTFHRLATSGVDPTRTALPAAGDVAGWAKRLGVPAFGSNTKKAISAYLAARKAGSPAELQAGVLTLLLSSPEWVVF